MKQKFVVNEKSVTEKQNIYVENTETPDRLEAAVGRKWVKSTILSSFNFQQNFVVDIQILDEMNNSISF